MTVKTLLLIHLPEYRAILHKLITCINEQWVPALLVRCKYRRVGLRIPRSFVIHQKPCAFRQGSIFTDAAHRSSNAPTIAGCANVPVMHNAVE